MSMESVFVAKEEEMPSGSVAVVEVRDRFLAVFHVGPDWYCIDNACPHRGGSLASGEVAGDTVICPWHAWPFSLKTGKSNDSDCWKVCTYPVEIAGGEVRITVPDRWPDLPAE